jgi:hypothetical protein
VKRENVLVTAEQAHHQRAGVDVKRLLAQEIGEKDRALYAFEDLGREDARLGFVKGVARRDPIDQNEPKRGGAYDDSQSDTRR